MGASGQTELFFRPSKHETGGQRVTCPNSHTSTCRVRFIVIQMSLGVQQRVESVSASGSTCSTCSPSSRPSFGCQLMSNQESCFFSLQMGAAWIKNRDCFYFLDFFPPAFILNPREYFRFLFSFLIYPIYSQSGFWIFIRRKSDPSPLNAAWALMILTTLSLKVSHVYFSYNNKRRELQITAEGRAEFSWMLLLLFLRKKMEQRNKEVNTGCVFT